MTNLSTSYIDTDSETLLGGRHNIGAVPIKRCRCAWHKHPFPLGLCLVPNKWGMMIDGFCGAYFRSQKNDSNRKIFLNFFPMGSCKELVQSDIRKGFFRIHRVRILKKHLPISNWVRFFFKKLMKSILKLISGLNHPCSTRNGSHKLSAWSLNHR